MGQVVSIDGTAVNHMLIDLIDTHPSVKVQEVSIEGANGSIDMSTSYTGGVKRYQSKTVTAAWYIPANSRTTAVADAQTIMDELATACRNGRITLTSTSRQGMHFLGRPQLSGGFNKENRGCEPVLNVTGGPLWVDDASTLQTVAASASPGTSATLTNSGDAAVAIEYKCSSQLVVQVEQGSFTIPASSSWTRLDGLVLLPGDTAVTVTGSGSLQLRWTEEHL